MDLGHFLREQFKVNLNYHMCNVSLLQGLKIDERTHGLVFFVESQIGEFAVQLVEKKARVGEYALVVLDEDDQVGAPQFGLVFYHLDPAAVQPLEFGLEVNRALNRKVDEHCSYYTQCMRFVISWCRVVIRLGVHGVA